MADPLSITVGVIGLLEFAGATLTKGYRILRSLQESSKDVERLLAELSQMTGVLVAIEAQDKEAKKVPDTELPETKAFPQILNSSIIDCRKVMKRISEMLEKLEKSRRTMFAVKWQFLEPDVKKLTGEIEHYKTVFILCLGIDVRKKTDEILSLQMEISLRLSDMQDEHEKEKIVAQEERAQHNRQALLRWLVPKSDEKHAKASKLWTQGTCNWLFENIDFISWVEGQESLLWLNGIPGSGKTVLMSRVIERLKEPSDSSMKPRGLAYFYCTYTQVESNRVSQVLCSLIAQLIRCLPHPEASPAMRLFKDCDDGTLTPNVNRTQDLLVSLINDMESVYICLDALDECDPDDKNELLRFICDDVRKFSNVKIILSSRIGDSDIRDYLDGCRSITVTPSAVARDIDQYVRHRIRHGSERLRRAQPEKIVEKLTVGGEGMFLWVSCQIDQLSRLNTSASVQAALNSLPRGLYATYDRILKGISPENEIYAVRALQWLAHAAAPLGLPELVEAISIEEESTSLHTLQKLFVPEDIFQICGSLIRRSDLTEKLSLAHNSVYEFLTTTSSSKRPPAPYYIPKAQSAIVLARTCLTYLSFQNFSMAHVQASVDPNLSIVSPSETGGPELSLDLPFFDYALRHWWKHLPSTPEGMDQMWPSLTIFFNRETGNFGSVVMLLRWLQGTYRYPMTILPIHFCAIHGLFLVSKRLLDDSPTEVERVVEDGRQALHMAAEKGHREMVQHLLSYDADVNKKTVDGRTPLQLALESGNESIIELLVQGGSDVNVKFSYGETALSVAVGNSWHSVVQLLVHNGADPNGRLLRGRTSLHVAAEVGSDRETMLYLIEAGADLTLGDENSWTALHLAAHYGHREAVMVLLEDPASFSIFTRVGWTPLHAAIEQEHIEIVRLFGKFAHSVSTLLANHGVRQRRISPSNPRLTHFKARGTATDADEFSTSTGSIPTLSQPGSSSANLTQELVPTPLFLATSQSYLAGVDALMIAGADPKDVRVCIQHAFTTGKGNALVRLVSGAEQPIKSLLRLLETGGSAPPDSGDVFKPLFTSLRWKIDEILAVCIQVVQKKELKSLLKLLLVQFLELEDESGNKNLDHLGGVLHAAVKYKNLEAVQELKIAGADLCRRINTVLGQYEPKTVTCTLLHQASDIQDLSMVDYLLSSALSADVRDTLGRTPLHYAVQLRYSKQTATIIRLLSSGADVSARDDEGWTPLHLASHYDSSASIPSLLAAGAQVTALDSASMTPLHHCAFSFSYNSRFPTAAMQLLLDSGASTSALDKSGYNPIQLALITYIKNAVPHSISAVLDQHVDLISSRFSPLNWTPLHFAAEANCGSTVLNILFSRGADLEAEDTQGRTPLEVAGTTAHRLLINQGAKWRI